MRRLPLLFVIGLSVFLLFGSGGQTAIDAPAGSDKLAHVLLFAALAWTGRLAGVPIRTLVVALFAYAALSEVLQSLVPWADRSTSWGDLVADAGGIVVGVLVPLPPRRQRAAGSGRTNL